MKTSKQKPKMGKPKIVEKTLRTPDRVRSVSSNMKENMPDGDNKNYNEYATDNVTQKGEYVARKGIAKTTDVGKKIVRKGYDKAKEHIKNRDSQHYGTGSNKANSSNSYKNTAKSNTKKNQTQHAKTKNAKKLYDANAIKIKKSVTKFAPKTKGSKSVKSTQKAIKKTKKSIKTAQRTAKATAKTAKQSVKMARRAAVIAKKTALATAKTVKVTAKAAVAAVKAAIASIKALITAIAAGGWVAVVIILVIALIVFLASSPWGIFFEDTDENTPTISELVTELNGEFSAKITNIIVSAGEIDEIITDVDSSTADFRVSNWIDVLGIFAVKSSANPNKEEYMDVLIMDEQKIEILRSVFWSMNTVTFEIVEEPILTPEPTATPSEPTPTPNPDISPTPEPTPEIYRTLIISIESKTYEQGAELYNFNNNQIELLDELMSAEYYTLFMEICGMNSFNGLTPEQATLLINDLPEGELGSEIVRYAITRLGDPYSQAKRGQGSYVDCSYLARWCYSQAGVSHFTAGTAAEQARYCVNNGLTIAKSSLQAGDLVFWSFKTNGRFMNVSHVGIYAGNGMVIDASSSRGIVVYRELFGAASQVCYGRPHVK